jgi:pilus assembly protein Flp/PilA
MEGGETHMLNEFMTFVQSLTGRISLRDESGQALVEYGLLVGLIAVACIAALVILGPQIAGLFTQVTTAIGNIA